MSKQAAKPELELERAQQELAEAKKRFANTKGALQYRLKPANLAHNAWDGVREKSSVAADGAMGAVKGHPASIGGVAAALALFLARKPVWRALSGIFGHGRDKPDPSIVSAKLDQHDANFDLTAPTVERSRHEGVIA
ncbi:MAG TPA: hypothetical protein VF628_11405 [Allosphingosinicella sp.]|jgi:hypothetical protein